MAIGTVTPRDQLDKIIAYVRRAMRYWWLVGIIAAVGGALAAVFAFTSKPKYLSESRILHNERIDSSLLLGRDMVNRTRNLGTKYSELLLARSQLKKVITELGLMKDTIASHGVEQAINDLKEQITFRIRGAGMFHIQFVGASPDEAQAVATMLTDILLSEDRRLRQESANETEEFLVKEKAERSAELVKRQRALYEFLAEHPEFALDSAQGTQAAAGASIRAAAQGKANEALRDLKETDPRLEALARQRRRIKASLEAPEQPAGPKKSPEQLEAERIVREAKNNLRRAERDLENKLSQFTATHPDVKAAKKNVSEAQERVQQAEAAVPPAPPKPTEVDRAALARELLDLDRQISTTRSQIRREKQGDEGVPEPGEEPKSDEQPENWIVALEDEFARLTDAVAEARSRVSQTDSSLSKAEITASQQMAEEGAVLSIIDPPNRPNKPEGKGPIFLTAAGIMAFLVMGSTLALALALVDDRLYTAGDLESLHIASVLVVIPRASQKKRSRRG